MLGAHTFSETMDRAGITVSAVHQRSMIMRQNSKLQGQNSENGTVSASAGGSSSEVVCANSETGQACCQTHSMHLIPPSMGAQKAQIMAELCREVAANGFEPLKDVFSLKGW
jgi:hypothetical protein